jgi:hypothetical protein
MRKRDDLIKKKENRERRSKEKRGVRALKREREIRERKRG